MYKVNISNWFYGAFNFTFLFALVCNTCDHYPITYVFSHLKSNDFFRLHILELEFLDDINTFWMMLIQAVILSFLLLCTAGINWNGSLFSNIPTNTGICQFCSSHGKNTISHHFNLWFLIIVRPDIFPMPTCIFVCELAFCTLRVFFSIDVFLKSICNSS